MAWLVPGVRSGLGTTDEVGQVVLRAHVAVLRYRRRVGRVRNIWTGDTTIRCRTVAACRAEPEPEPRPEPDAEPKPVPDAEPARDWVHQRRRMQLRGPVSAGTLRCIASPGSLQSADDTQRLVCVLRR